MTEQDQRVLVLPDQHVTVSAVGNGMARWRGRRTWLCKCADRTAPPHAHADSICTHWPSSSLASRSDLSVLGLAIPVSPCEHLLVGSQASYSPQPSPLPCQKTCGHPAARSGCTPLDLWAPEGIPYRQGLADACSLGRCDVVCLLVLHRIG